MAKKKNEEKKPSRESPSGSILNTLWAMNAVEDIISKTLPKGSDTVTVAIAGKPKSDLDKLHNLALCIIAGILNESFFPNTSTFIYNSQIHHTEKVIQVTVAFQVNGTVSGAESAAFGKGIARNIARRTIPDPIFLKMYNDFLRIKEDKLPVGIDPLTGGKKEFLSNDPATPFITTNIDLLKTGIPAYQMNPGMAFNRGTSDQFNTLAKAGPLIEPIDKPQPATNDARPDLPTNSAIVDKLKKLFGLGA